MSLKRAVVTGLLVGLYLVLVGGVALSAPDCSWSLSYFDDDDDDDFLPLLTERAPLLIVVVALLLLIIAGVATVLLLHPCARPLLAPPRSRLRAPPLS